MVNLVVLGLVFAIACSSTTRSVQSLTYPPDFAYIPPERLQSTMWILAAEVKQLDQLLGQAPAPDDAATQEAVRRSLQRMSVAIEQIDHPGRASQHPALNIHLRRFAERLEQAQRGADRTPPNYFQATALSGSCFLCHSSDGGG
jgi:hypothetical protein